MGSSVTFYTQPMLETSIVTDVESTAVGDKKYLLDQNPDTYHKQTYKANFNHTIVDTNLTVNQVDAYGIRFRDYDTATGMTGALMLDYSTNGTDWTNGDATPFEPLNGNPLWVADLAAAYTNKRYLRFRYLATDVTPEVSDVFLLRKYTISRGAEMPIQDNTEYANAESDLMGGRKLVRAQFRKPVTHFTRKYLISGSTMKGYIDSIIANCRGTLYPFIIQEGTTLAELQYCRFDSVPIIREIAYLFYEVTMEFSTIPYIQDGYAY